MTEYAVPTILTENDYEVRSLRAIPTGNHYNDFNSGSQFAEGVFSNQTLGVAGISVIVSNYTDRNIVIVDRWNAVMMIPPVPYEIATSKGMNGSVLIEVVHSKPRRILEVDDPTYNQYARFHKRKSKTVRKEFYRDRRITGEDSPPISNQVTSITIPNVVSILENSDNGVFVQEAGLVLALADTNVLFVHPDTPTSDLIDYFPHEPGVNNEFTLRMFINDTTHRFNRAYINIGGLVIDIPITRSGKDKDGIHCTRQLGVGRRKRELVHEFYEFDDPKCPLKIFSNKETAATLGDPNKFYDHEINKTKQETTAVKASTDLALAEIKRIDFEEDQLRKIREKEIQYRESIRAEIQREEQEKRDREIQEAQRKAAIAKANADAAAAKMLEEQKRRQNIIDTTNNRSRLLTEFAKAITAVVGVSLSFLAILKLKSNG